MSIHKDITVPARVAADSTIVLMVVGAVPAPRAGSSLTAAVSLIATLTASVTATLTYTWCKPWKAFDNKK